MMTVQEIEMRVEEAFKTFHYLPDVNKHKAVKSFWPEYHYTGQELWSNYGREEARMPRIVPSPEQISRAQEVMFKWFPRINTPDEKMNVRYKKTVAYRAMGMRWKQIAFLTSNKATPRSVRQCQLDYETILNNFKVWFGQ